MTQWFSDLFGDSMRERKRTEGSGSGPRSGTRILKKGAAMRVIFFYPGEEGTYVDHAYVTLYDNGIVHIRSDHEESTTHLQNCEVIWKYGAEAEERTPKVRLLKPKAQANPESAQTDSSEEKNENPPSTSPDLS